MSTAFPRASLGVALSNRVLYRPLLGEVDYNPGTTSLVSYWGMNGSIADQHGSNDLTASGGGGYGTGKQGQGIDLEASSSQYLYVADNASLSREGKDFTLSLWVKPESAASPDSRIIAAKETYDDEREFHISQSSTAGFVFGLPQTPAYTAVTDPVTVVPSNWYHVTVWRNTTTKELGIKVNDRTPVTNTYISDFVASTGQLRFGISEKNGLDTDEPTRFFDGIIDEVCLYDRTLTADEIEWLYNDGAGRSYGDLYDSPGTTDLLSWWTLTESGGTDRQDSHGSVTLAETGGDILGIPGPVSRGAQFYDWEYRILQATDPPSMSFGNSSFSIAGWMKIRSWQDGLGTAVFLAKWSTDNHEWLLGWSDTANKAMFVVSGDGVNNTSVFGDVLTIDEWYFVVGVHDAENDEIKISVNGGEFATTAFAGGTTPTATAGPLISGGYTNLSPDSIAVAEPCVFSRTLTADEIAWLYNGGAGRIYREVLNPVNPTTTDLLSWWPLDETSGTRYDAHSDNNLADYNTVEYLAGKQGNAAYFVDGDDSYLYKSLATSGDFEFGDTNYSVCAWVKRVDADWVSGTVIGKWDWDGAAHVDSEWRLQVFSTKYPNFGVGTGTGTTMGGVSWGSTIDDENWHFLAGGFDSDNDEIWISVDGGTKVTAAFTGTPFSGGANALMMGACDWGFYFQGQIDETKIFTKTLTAPEILWLYNNGDGKSYADVANANPGATNLLSWWSLDETSGTRYDQQGGFDLTDDNTVGYAAGKQGNAADFEGGNVEHLYNASFSNTFHQNDFTVCCWVKLESLSLDRPAMAQYHNSLTRHWLLWYDATDDKWEFSMRNAANDDFRAEMDGTTADTDWHFIAATRSGNTLTIYFDGSAGSTTATFSGTELSDDQNLEIGKGLGAYYFDGLIDEAAIFTSALTPSEILWLYNNGNGRSYIDTIIDDPLIAESTVAEAGFSWGLVSTNNWRAFTIHPNLEAGDHITAAGHQMYYLNSPYIQTGTAVASIYGYDGEPTTQIGQSSDPFDLSTMGHHSSNWVYFTGMDVDIPYDGKYCLVIEVNPGGASSNYYIRSVSNNTWGSVTKMWTSSNGTSWGALQNRISTYKLYGERVV